MALGTRPVILDQSLGRTRDATGIAQAPVRVLTFHDSSQ
jgi:hypothetical protein